MRRLGMVVAIVVVAALAAAGVAAANRFAFSSSGFRLVWPAEGPLLIRKPTEAFGIDDLFNCPVTLEGSFHSATLMRKVSGGLAGNINRAVLGRCNTERSWLEQPQFLVATLPWHLRYSSFAGTLPRVTSVSWSITGFAFSAVERGFFRLNCLYRAPEPLVFRTTRESLGAITAATLEGRVEKTTMGGECAFSGTLSGAPRVTALGSTSAVTVTLI